MKGYVTALVLAVLWMSPAWTDESSAEFWIGKHRDEIVEKWGAPAKTKNRKKGGKILIYELPVFVGEFRPADPGSTGVSTSRDDFSWGEAPTTSKGETMVEAEGAPPEPAYKKVKFKFYIDGAGKVEKVAFPEHTTTGTGSP